MPLVPFDFLSARIPDLLPDEAAYAAAYAGLPDWRRRKCDGFRTVSDRFRSAAVWLLLRRLMAVHGLDADAMAVTENAFGKPDGVAGGGLHFSLSHAKDRVLAVIGPSPLGCDVERIAHARMEVVRECFTEDERRHVETFPEGEERDRAFCRLWVRKECYVKAVGRGFDLPPGSFSVTPGTFPAGWRCVEWDFADGYLGAACVGMPDIVRV